MTGRPAVDCGCDRHVRLDARRVRFGRRAELLPQIRGRGGNILARPDDDGCGFGTEILTAEAESALRRHGYNAVVLRPPVVIDGVTLDVSALVLPVLDVDACVATRVRLVIGGDGVLLAAEHFSLLTRTTTGLLRRVSASVSRDVGRDRQRDEEGGGWWTLTAALWRSCRLANHHSGAGNPARTASRF